MKVFPKNATVGVVDVVPSRRQDRRQVEAFLRGHNSLRVARRGELVDSMQHPCLVAWSGDGLMGVATYVISGSECELLTLHARTRFTGTGSALVAAVENVAKRELCTRLWVVTTNDNCDALRFYQRRRFQLAQLRPGAVTSSRRGLKPEIPTLGLFGIPIRDELELELFLTAAGQG